MTMRHIAASLRIVVASGWVLVGVGLMRATPVRAQSVATCGPAGYRVITGRWDAVLKINWELRRDCGHPEWPARMVATSTARTPSAAKPRPLLGGSPGAAEVTAAMPLLVRAGEVVRLWEQDERVHIELSGVVEQSARLGERVLVRITHEGDDAGLSVEQIGGVVRGAGDVEMER